MTTLLAPERCEYPKGLTHRALVNEAKGLRIDCNQPPYRDELRNNCGQPRWFAQTNADFPMAQRACLLPTP